jgi:hypothetical protein
VQGVIVRTLALALGALLLAAAGPPPAEYALADVTGEALVVPASSPVAFTGFEEHLARFGGQFELTGTLVYRCSVDCDLPVDPRSLIVFVVPDPGLAEHLPYWKTRRAEIHVYFENDEALASAVVTAAERQELLSGKAAEVRKRVTLTVADFRLGIDCDSASYSARFVALTEPPVLADTSKEIDIGCS